MMKYVPYWWFGSYYEICVLLRTGMLGAVNDMGIGG